jgi:hypothetical protein
MREGVVVSAVFFTAAVALLLAGQHVVPNVAYMQHLVLLVGFLLLLFAPVILVLTFLISVIPGAREKLDKCEH